AFQRIKNRELVIGGMVTSAAHRMTKSGKPYGVFMFEDYTDSYEIAIFSEDYVKHKGYLQEGYFLQLRGIVQERFRKPENWGFEIKAVQLLSELREKLAKSITIQLPLHGLDEDTVARLSRIVEANGAHEA